MDIRGFETGMAQTFFYYIFIWSKPHLTCECQRGIVRCRVQTAVSSIHVLKSSTSCTIHCKIECTESESFNGIHLSHSSPSNLVSLFKFPIESRLPSRSALRTPQTSRSIEFDATGWNGRGGEGQSFRSRSVRVGRARDRREHSARERLSALLLPQFRELLVAPAFARLE